MNPKAQSRPFSTRDCKHRATPTTTKMVASVQQADPPLGRTTVGQAHAGRGRRRAAALCPSIRAPGRGALSSRSFQNNLSSQGEGGGRKETKINSPVPAPPLLLRPDERKIWKHDGPVDT